MRCNLFWNKAISLTVGESSPPELHREQYIQFVETLYTLAQRKHPPRRANFLTGAYQIQRARERAKEREMANLLSRESDRRTRAPNEAIIQTRLTTKAITPW